MLVDGVRVSSAMSGYADLSTIPADSIDRIEVVRSGASALYGSDAVGGVINIITKKKAAPLTISVENGSFVPAGNVQGYGLSKTLNGPDYLSLVDSQKLSFSVAPYIGNVGLRASGGFTRAGNDYTFFEFERRNPSATESRTPLGNRGSRPVAPDAGRNADNGPHRCLAAGGVPAL